MQDPSSGDFYPITQDFTKALEKAHEEASHAVGRPVLTRILSVGDEVRINGARLKVVTIGQRFVKLEGIAADDPEGEHAATCRRCGEPCSHC